MLMIYNEREKRRVFEGGSLDLFSDPEMEAFFSKGIRGGQSFISQRKADGEKNPEKAGYHLLYVDGKSNYFFFCYSVILLCFFFLQPTIYMGAWKR